MAAYIRAELLKQKRSFNKKLIWIAPLLTVLLAGVLMGGAYMEAGAYNWWYMLLLPGCFTMISGFTVTRERRKNRHGLFGVAIRKKRLWLAQVLICTGYLWLTCMLFFVLVGLGGGLTTQTLSLLENFAASLVLFICFAWQIPLWMWLTEKMGALFVVILSLVCNFILPVLYADKGCWWIPFAIPARLMCACIGVMPNGLSVEMGSILTDRGVILPGICIAIILYGVVTGLTAVWFEKREV